MEFNFASIILFAVIVAGFTTAEPWVPIPQPGDSYLERHESFVQYSQEHGSEIKIVFIGSSSVERWGSTGSAIWESKYEPLGAVNYGIGADKTENTLWRIENGELDGLSPKLVVIYTGSNNVPANPSDEIVQGVVAVIDAVKSKVPGANVLFIEFFPRGDTSDLDSTWKRIHLVGHKIRKLYEGCEDMVTTISLFWDLVEQWTEIKTELYSGDKLHMNEAGYAAWDQLMNSTFYKLLQ